MPNTRPNIVLLIVDSLRPDHLGVYGYQKNISPRLNAFAWRGAVFTQAIAQAPWTLPSVASIMTSLYPSEHGIVLMPENPGRFNEEQETAAIVPRAGQKLARGTPTLAAILSANGYRTAGAFAITFCSPVFGFDSGFETYRRGSSFKHLNDICLCT